MTTPKSSLEQQHLEEIVAYLDGELSADESIQVEERLSVDETYRQQLQGFDRAWSALDELPGLTTSDNFSKTTMEMVVDAAQQDVRAQTIALPTQRRKRGLASGILIAAAVLVGIFSVRLFRSDPNAMLLADLPAIQYIDLYTQFQSVDFLRKLRQALGGDQKAIGLKSTELSAQVEQFQLVSSEQDRRAWLAGLTPDEKLSLRAKYNRYCDLSPDQRQRIQKIHQAIVATDESQQLERTLFLYGQWLSSLPPSEQFELRELPLDRRVRMIAHKIQVDQSKSPLDLTDQQLETLVKKFRSRLPKMIDSLTDEQKKNLGSHQGRRGASAFIKIAMDQQSNVGQELRSIISETLTDEQREQFDQLPYGWQSIRIGGWLRAAMSHNSYYGRSKEGPPRVSEQELEEFFSNELTATLREKLLAMPRDEMQHRLRQLYRGQGNVNWWNGNRPDRPSDHPGPPPGRHRFDWRGPPPHDDPGPDSWQRRRDRRRDPLRDESRREGRVGDGL